MGHETRNWKAVEASDPVGSRRTLTVSGQFQSHRSNEKASLKEATPPGINPTILILDMQVSSHGVGSDIVQWKDVDSFTTPVSSREFKQVTIRHDGKSVTVGIEEILS